jgi:tetratricopeptide (TPR) repeat protein
LTFLECYKLKGAEMKKLHTIFICFLLAVAILLQGCTFQGPVKEIITEKSIARANTYMQEGNYEDAITYYTRALKVNPKDSIAYNNRGLAWWKKGDYDNAIADFTKAVEIDLKFADAYKNRGNAYYDKGDYDRTCSDFQKSCELGFCKRLNWAIKEGICNK